MARPRKSDDDKLVPVSTNVPRADYIAMQRYAVDHRIPFARVLRVLLVTRFRNLKTQPDRSPSTL